MTQKDFFTQLKDELHGHPYRDRYLEELEAHAEDMQKEELNEEQWIKRMGEVAQINETFKAIMHSHLEIILWIIGILTILFILFVGNLIVQS